MKGQNLRFGMQLTDTEHIIVAFYESNSDIVHLVRHIKYNLIN